MLTSMWSAALRGGGGGADKLEVRDLINEPHGLGVNSLDVEASRPCALHPCPLLLRVGCAHERP